MTDVTGVAIRPSLTPHRHFPAFAVGVSSVSLDATNVDAYRGQTKTFNVTMVGTDVHDVEWTLTGFTPLAGYESQVSSISTETNDANVQVSEYETASTLTLPITASRLKNEYRCIVTDSLGEQVVSESVRILQ